MAFRRLSFAGVDVVLHVPRQTVRKALSLGGLRAVPPDAVEGVGAPASLPAPIAGQSDLARQAAAIDWYHTIDLGGGVVTSGWFDLRAQVPFVPLPDRLDGLRVLDVATFDGFWAFELERRGAAEIVAIDIDNFGQVDMSPRLKRDKPAEYFTRKTGEGFRLASRALGSKVQREVCNVYDLSPERVGMFDVVFLSDLLLHLANPMKALANLCSVTRGHAVIVDVFNPSLAGRLASYEGGVSHNIWWDMSFGALQQMIIDAGFSSVEHVRDIPFGYRDQRKVMMQAAFICRK